MALELASSTAGLTGLARLFVQSASSLYAFCRNFPHVAAEVEAVIEEIKILQELLPAIQEVEQNGGTSSQARSLIAKLTAEIASCSADLTTWSQNMEVLTMRNGEKVRNMVNKLKLAVDKGRLRR